MHLIKTIVVDDEFLARKRIINLLKGQEDIHIIAECKNGKEAVEKINQLKPDLVFLDVQMPDLNGFEVLQSGLLQHHPFIIFVTAFDHYAIQAFDVKAMDYLLKPYDNERFTQALNHARSQVGLKKEHEFHHKLLGFIDHYQKAKNQANFLEIKLRGITKKISLDLILYIEADGNYVHIHTARNRYLLRATLQELEQKLESPDFLRIHRSIMINTAGIRSYRYLSNNKYEFTMENEIRLISSRGYKEQIQEFISRFSETDL